MATGLSAVIKSLVIDRGVSEELILQTIEDFLLAAYKRRFGTSENAVVKFDNDGDEVTLYSRKIIVKEVEDEVLELPLDEALLLNDECEVGDELLIEIDPKSFDRIAVQSAKQKAKQTLREIQKDTLYSEFKGKEGEMVIGYYQRDKNGDIFIDLGKTEGILPKRFQSPREIYRRNDRVKTLIYSVEKSPSGLRIMLSRTHTDFVKKLFDLEVPELYDNSIEIYKIVREPGYRTKLAVYSNRDDIDPVGACVGLKGIRIQTIVRELEGEKIDVLKYETDPTLFIKNALSPAEVKQVYILDEAKRSALAVVSENQLSLAIGKQGLNVRLANRLADWNIDVKTEEQFLEMDIAQESRRGLNALFSDEFEDEIINIDDIPGVDERIVSILEENEIVRIEDYINMSDSDLSALPGLSESDIKTINEVINEYVDIVDIVAEEAEEAEEAEKTEKTEKTEEEYEETFECPECGHALTDDMTSCPSCGVGLSFEEESVEEE
ncbi:MAG: transcription termination/antitermination protein NusA [Bacteroidetes bacterium]|nr:transcription termination/antitermination protein NusA [Bacteroidota bacterium]